MEKNKKIKLIDNEQTIERTDERDPLWDKFKKPVIFCLMGVVFISCLYLIFKPPGEEQGLLEGLKNAVPEATEKELQADKQKAYEKEMLEAKEAEKRNALLSLSDYWNNDTVPMETSSELRTREGGPHQNYERAQENNSLQSYRDAQMTLGSFYRDDDREKLELRKKVDELKDRLSEKEVPAAPTLNDQLVLMEKSYEMASKYLPTGQVMNSANPHAKTIQGDSVGENHAAVHVVKENVEAVRGIKKNVVTSLYREQDEQFFFEGLAERNLKFITPGQSIENAVPGNSIRATVIETKTITGEGSIRLRLSEIALIGGYEVPKGTEVIAQARLQGNKLQMKVSSIQILGNIIPVELTVYDSKGQSGLIVPNADEINAVGEIAANMTQSSGMNISMSRSAGQQVAGDLSRGLLQGISGYFSKKLRAAKVTVKSGHQVFLVSKNSK